ncbi:MAG: hypothetical protein LUD15_09305, partial [Bacteroides sp.]|nr:hypothetical protein [Bacteroides sp.]
SKVILTSADPSIIEVENGGRIKGKKDGTATINIAYTGPLGDSKEKELIVHSSTFPLTNKAFNPSIWEEGTFDEVTRTLVTGQWGFGGWKYNNGVDISRYRQIVVELGNDNEAGVSFRLFDENNYWTDPAMYDFGNSRRVEVQINNIVKENGQKLDPSHIYIAGFWSSGGKPIIIKDIYLVK